MTTTDDIERLGSIWPKPDFTDLEDELLSAALDLASAEESLSQEYLMRVAAGVPSFQAQKMAEVTFLPTLRNAQALYEIALNRMRKS